MMLQPRKFIYKTRQKLRKKYPITYSQLSFGDMGLRSLSRLRLTNKQLFRLTIFFKKSVRKSELTKRSFWIHAFPHLPLTRKSKGMRMGKGQGKLNLWHSNSSSGKILIEFRHLRFGRAKYFLTQLNAKLSTPTSFVKQSSKQIKIARSRRLNVSAYDFLN